MKTSAISCKDVKILDGFWKERQKINRNVTLDAVYNRFDDMGKIEAFWCTWKPADGDGKKPHLFWDSDIAKWIEGASYVLMHEKNEEIEKKIDYMIAGLEKNMTQDGYFNMYYNLFGFAERFTNRNNHELYCAGHHIEAACAYFAATGKDTYLNLMIRFADLIYKIFVVEESAYFVTPGHPEIEIALIKLYRTTGNKKYLDLCSFFVEKRSDNDKDKPIFNDPLYALDNVKIRKASFAEGHSVRLNYLMSGVCDLAYETGDGELLDAAKRVFDNATKKRMYITGGQGSTYMGERYTSDWHLPNKTAYAETCASISLGMYARRLELCETNSYYGDIMERTLYNNTLSGVSLDGDSFFYENPLEIRNEDYAVKYYDFVRAGHYIPRVRQKMFGCSCCPPNIVRTVAGIGDYIYSYSSDEDILFVNQFISSSYEKDGKSVCLSTEFPKNGKISVKAEGFKKIAVRIPYYCKHPEISTDYTVENGYAFIEVGAKLDVEIDLCLKARFVYANTNIYDNIGRAAIMYGPCVYCAETADNESVENFFVDTNAKIEIADAPYGVPNLVICGERQVSSDDIYSEEPPKKIAGNLKMIPYFAFANRGEQEMLTYFPIK